MTRNIIDLINNKYKADSNTKIEFAAISIIIFLFINYIWQVFPHVHNIPKANDDVKIFLFHLYKLFSNPDFGNFIDYLFNYNNNPHIKLDARLISLITYFIYGKTNYKFILIVGHIVYLSSFVLLRYTFPRIQTLVFVPVAFIFLIPSWPTALWSVAVWGYNTQIFLLCLTAYFLSKNQHYKAILTCIFGTFTLGSGITIFVLGLSYSLYQYVFSSKKKIKELISWIIAFLISSSSLILVVINTLARPENSTNQDFNFLSFINYNVLFLFNGLKPTSALIPIVLGISYIILIALVSILWFQRKKIKDQTVLAVLMLLVIIAHSFVSSIFRLDVSETLPNVPDRYEVFSFCFLGLLILILFDLIRDNNTLLKNITFSVILILSIVLYAGKITIVSVGIEKAENSIKNKLVNALVDNKEPVKKYHILNYLERGMYQPPLEELRNDHKIAKPFFQIDSSLIIDIDSNINIITNLNSTYFNLTEFYIVKNQSKDYYLQWGSNMLLRFENRKIYKLNNFKQNRKKIESTLHELSNGFILQFPIDEEFDPSSNKYILTIGNNGEVESALKI